MHNPKHFFNQLSQLVGCASVSSASPQWDMGNRDVINLLATWLEDLGFAIDIIPIEGNPNKANMIATLGDGPGGLVLAGHTDTVPCNPEKWQQNPFKLTERDNRLYGLGATDMKGFFPVVLAAVEQFKHAKLQQPIIILATADEESSMSGARQLVTLGKPKARYAVIGEPTELKPIRMHKGILMEAIRVEGMAGHSSNPALGNNAMETMNLVITELLSFRREMQQKFNNPCFDVNVPTLNLGHIHGGDNPNRICGSCELHFDLRPLPGMNINDLRHDIDRRLEPLRQSSKSPIICRPLFEGVEPFEQEKNSPLILATEALSGSIAQSVAFATEAPFMKELGMDTVVFGPGSIDQAHQPNEYIGLDQINPAINAITQLIQRFCLQSTQPLTPITDRQLQS